MKLTEKKAIVEHYLQDTDKSLLQLSEELDLPTWEISNIVEEFKMLYSFHRNLYLVPSFLFPGDFFLFDDNQEIRRVEIDEGLKFSHLYTPYELTWLKEVHGIVAPEKSSYEGVQIAGKTWQWRLNINKKTYTKSGFKTEEEAAEARHIFKLINEGRTVK